ncbi:MAG: bifunctional diaminohydroxyphosphoribosylaminopyrimidine deaminase/5-amino-6-(5-phosphoribosylamino)uracil reductase RibD [Fimbriimonadaceae bacterium]|nr:bifunctional diaminohydroxyphosphoribosylaminopyrimidine deaminase/5-amino-6-(5-phosphoribosylamino)uracil reductase RibD [Fimbriimonadaceae bacterium]
MVETDDRWMARAVRLARKGFPAPNPRVGCVIVMEGELVGEGHHDHAGGPHAEAVALKVAGSRAKGATVYVTLEPCRHTGRTPPCVRALIHAQVRRVVVATLDPNPVAAGGIQELRDAGVQVDIGVLLAEAEDVNRVFLTAHRLQRSYVCLKAATSLDGFMAPEHGASGWITSERARRQGHKLRAEMGCVLVGRGTVVSDDPRLTARIRGVVNQPKRIVLDPSRRLSGKEQVFSGPGSAVRVVGSDRGAVDDWVLPSRSGLFKPSELAQLAFSKGIVGMLVEGGPGTLAEFLRDGTGDQIEWFVSPNLLGSGKRFDLSMWTGKPWAWRLPRLLGEDVWLRAVRA